MKKRLWSLLLVLVMLFSVIPARNASAAVSYSVSKALDYAKANWDKNPEQLCAEFVYRCVKAGGLSLSKQTFAGSCMTAIENASGVKRQLLTLDSKGNATKSLDGNILAAGDPVVQYCTTCKKYPHIILCAGFDSSGRAVYYGHNGAMNKKTYNLTVNKALHGKSTCKLVGYVCHISALDTTVGNNASITNVNVQPGTYGATFNFDISYTGTKPSTIGFYYGREDYLGKGISTAMGGTANPYKFSYTLDNLEHNTTYYYQPYVVQNGKTIKGAISSFKTKADTSSLSVVKQTDCGYNIRIPNGMEYAVYEVADSRKTISILEAVGDKTIFCTKRLQMSDNTVRYAYKAVDDNEYYLRFYSGSSGSMSSTQVHNYTKTTVVAATCKSDGYTLHSCGCGASYKDSYTSGGTHSWGVWQTNSNGEKIRYCSLCGTMQKGTVVVGPDKLAFKDVVYGSYCYDPIVWAVSKGITNGVSSTRFAPNDICTRGQVVTFLWRTAGSPEPTSTNHPFKDIDSTAFYYKAVLWAVENGITNGTSSDTFSPGDSCTRGHVVTFLHRFAGSPLPADISHPFKDVNSSSFYYKPMLWAVSEGITNGLTKDTFGPADFCTRGQIVTFLYRAMP